MLLGEVQSSSGNKTQINSVLPLSPHSFVWTCVGKEDMSWNTQCAPSPFLTLTCHERHETMEGWFDQPDSRNTHQRKENTFRASVLWEFERGSSRSTIPLRLIQWVFKGKLNAPRCGCFYHMPPLLYCTSVVELFPSGLARRCIILPSYTAVRCKLPIAVVPKLYIDVSIFCRQEWRRQEEV